MDAQPSLISELDAALKGSSSSKRVEALRRVTDLFLANSSNFEAEHVDLFDGVLGRMIDHMESRALAELGHRLAPVGNAPANVIRRLAMHDEIDVAGPVLAQSSRLGTADLVSIAAHKSQGHLLAIAGRREIDTAVTDVLVERGNVEVARKVAVNEGARFSQGGFATLVRRAAHDDALAEGVGMRADIPPQLFKKLLEKATETVRARLIRHMPAEAAEGALQRLHGIAKELAAAVPDRDYTAARYLVESMERDGKLGENEVHAFARAGRFEETVVAVAVRAATPVEIVERVMNGRHIEALLIPCRAAGLEWATARAVMQLHAAHRSASEQSFATMRRDYLNLSPTNAQRILRFWQVRSTAEVAAG